MGWKISGIRERLGSPKGKILKMFKVTFNSKKEDLEVSAHAIANQDLSQFDNFNAQTYILGKQRMHEIETQKAMVIIISRHESWKAGGPY